MQFVQGVWRAWSFQLGVLITVLAGVEQFLPGLKASIGADTYGWVQMGVGVTLIVLRSVRQKAMQEKTNAK